MNQRPHSHVNRQFTSKRLFTLVLVLGLLAMASSSVFGAGFYNETDYTLFAQFTPDQCGDTALIPRAFCATQVELAPQGSWSSNNRAGYVNAGGQTIHYNRNASGKGFSEIRFEYMECYVDRQGWVKFQALFGADRVEHFKMIAYDETGKQTCTQTAKVVSLKI